MNTAESNKSFWSYVLAALVLVAAIVVSPAAWGNTEKAEFSIHLFQNGLPIADAELLINSESYDKSTAKLIFEAIPSTYSWQPDKGAVLKTNANGAAAGKLPPGFYHIAIKTKDQTFDFICRCNRQKMHRFL